MTQLIWHDDTISQRNKAKKENGEEEIFKYLKKIVVVGWLNQYWGGLHKIGRAMKPLTTMVAVEISANH